MEKISIIVPFLNAEKIIEKCIENLLKQTYQNIEIVLVNDYSTDKSEEVVKKYLNNEKIKYYKMEKNTIGNAAARNLGMQKSTGKYFIFVDVDDYIDNDLLNNLSKYIKEGFDLVKYKTAIISEKNEIIRKISGPVFEEKTGEEAFNALCFEDVFVDSPCLYLIKKEIIQNNDLKFEENSYHEDFGLVPQIILLAQKVASTNIYGYYYVQSQGSIMRNKNNHLKKAHDKLVHYDNMIKKLENFKISKKTKENVKIFYTNSIFLSINDLEDEDKKMYIEEINKRQMKKNIKIRNFKQLIKRILLEININMYLRLR